MKKNGPSKQLRGVYRSACSVDWLASVVANSAFQFSCGGSALAREVIPLNAVISLATLTSALVFRDGSLSFAPLAPNISDIIALAIGGLLAAFFASGLVARLSNETLHKAIVVLLDSAPASRRDGIPARIGL